MLNEVPYRGTPMPPTDPLIYRFYELVMVNGPAWKALIEEEFGDGIMSAIDFDMEMERRAQPQGRPRQDHHVRQVPALQVLRQRAGHPGVRLQGSVSARTAAFSHEACNEPRPPHSSSSCERGRCQCVTTSDGDDDAGVVMMPIAIPAIVHLRGLAGLLGDRAFTTPSADEAGAA